MQYDPKLKRVAAEISAILKKEDIAGTVVLHSPGHSEFVLEISPSYSGASIVKTPEGSILRIKAKAEDFPNGKEGRNKCLQETSNMFYHLVNTTGFVLGSLDRGMKMLEEHVGEIQEEEGTGGFTTHETQNN